MYRAAGMPDADVARFGRWTSNAYKLYIHIESSALAEWSERAAQQPDFDSSTADITAGVAHNEEASDLNFEAQGVFNLPLSDTLARQCHLCCPRLLAAGCLNAPN